MTDQISGPEPAGLKILHTGGAGFLGKSMVREILAEDSPVKASRLRIFDLKEYDGPPDARIEMVKGDLLDEKELLKACTGMDVVIHSAAIVDWGTLPEEKVYAVNYTGTLNVIKACMAAGVKYLIYTSSIDVIYTGKRMKDIDESVAYPDKHPNMYCRSKALAEKAVIAANGKGLTTCALRPADIYGPADPYHMGSLIDMAKGGFYVRLGDGKALSQHVFVGNIAHAHLQALGALIGGNTSIAGKAYFITDAPASNFFKFFDAIVEGAGYRIRPKNFWIPRNIAYAIGTMTELSALLIRPFKKVNPKFSRFAVVYTCSDFTYSAARAELDFGFVPKYSHGEAFERTVKFYRVSSS